MLQTQERDLFHVAGTKINFKTSVSSDSLLNTSQFKEVHESVYISVCWGVCVTVSVFTLGGGEKKAGMTAAGSQTPD